MIRVALCKKKKIIDLKSSMKIQHIQEKFFDINRPKTYKELEQEIRNKFNLNGKDISIKALLEDGDEKNINGEDRYNDDYYLTKTYNVYLEDEGEDSGNIDLTKNLDLDAVIDVSNELTIDENEFKLFLDKQLDKEINEEFKQEEKDNNNEKIDVKVELNNYFSKLEEEFKKISEEKKNYLMESIKKEFSSIDQILDKKISDINDIIKNVIQSNDAKEKISNIKLNMPQNGGDILDNHKQLPKMFNLFTSTNKYDILVNQADNFSINDIQIKNIINEKIDFNHKFWVRHEDSDPDIYIPSEKTEIKVDDGYLEGNEEKKTELYLTIKNPKINQNYFFKFYIGDNSKNNSIYEDVTDEPIFINITIIDEKKEEEEQKEEDVKKEKEEEIKEDVKKEKEEEIKNDVKKEKELVVENPKDEIELNEEEKNNDIKKEKKHDDKRDVLSEDRIQEIMEELDAEFYCVGVIGEDILIEKIKELNGDMEKLKKFVELNL
jgi:hypothetical protein